MTTRPVQRALPYMVGALLVVIIIKLGISRQQLITFGLIFWVILAVYVFREFVRFQSFKRTVQVLVLRLDNRDIEYQTVLMNIFLEIKVGDNSSLSHLWLRRSWVGRFFCEGGLHYSIGLTALAFDFSRSFSAISTERATTQLEWILIRYLRYSWGLGDTDSFRNASDCPIPTERELEEIIRVLEALMTLDRSRGQRRNIASEIDAYRDNLLPDSYLGSDVQIDEGLSRFLEELVRIIRIS